LLFSIRVHYIPKALNCTKQKKKTQLNSWEFCHLEKIPKGLHLKINRKRPLRGFLGRNPTLLKNIRSCNDYFLTAELWDGIRLWKVEVSGKLGSIMSIYGTFCYMGEILGG